MSTLRIHASTDEHAAFMALASSGSFLEAGRLIDRHPTVVTKRVKALEQRLGVRLVERTTRSLRLTEAGTRLAEQLRIAAELVSEAEHEASASVEAVSGKLRITLPATMGRLWLAEHIPAFASQHPLLHIEVHYSDAFVDLVEEGFDVAICIGHLKDSRLVARKLASHQRILCASPDYLAKNGVPGQPDDLAAHRCLEFTGLMSFPFWNLVNGNLRARVAARGNMRSNDPSALLEASKAGAGILGAGEWLAIRDIAAGQLVQVLPEWTFDVEADLYLVRPSTRHSPARVEAFVEWATNLFRRGPPWAHLTADQ